MPSVRKSIAISFAEKYATLLIQFFSTIVIARLLTPSEIGVFSVGAVIVGFAHMIRDFGVSNYIVQEQELTKERLRTAFGVTLIIAWSAALILFLFSGPIADLYEERGLSKVLNILASSFLLIPFSSTILGLLRRDLNFDKIFWINLASSLAHAITGCSLAYLGWGFESLAWATVASAASTVAIAILVRPDRAVFTPSLREFRRIFSFGSYSTGSSIAQEVGLSAPDLALGKLQGFDMVGYYSRAMGFISIFNQAVTAAISPVITPAFAKSIREDRGIKEQYLRALNYYTAVSWPFFGFTIVMAAPLIHVLYGEQWSQAVEPAQILCLAFILRSLTTFSGHVLTAQGKVKLQFKLQLLLQIPRALATIYAASYSISAVAWVQVVFYFISVIVFHMMIERSLGIRIIDLIHTTSKSAMVFSICLAGVITSNILFEENGLLISVISAGAALAALWITSIYLTSHDLKSEIVQILTAIKNRTN